MTIAITAATGQLGGLALQSLKSRVPTGEVVAVVRSPDKAKDLGVPVRKADYHDPAALTAAFAGVNTLVLISSSDFNDRAGQHRNVIAAAQAAHVKRVIYTSLLKGPASPMLLAADHIATEEALGKSGLATTILRNGWYTENLTATLTDAIKAGALIGAAGEGKLSTASRADYAEAIAVVASEEGHAGKVYELSGDVGHTMAEFAAEVSSQVGKQIPYKSMPASAYAEVLCGLGIPEPVAKILADADAWAAKGMLFDNSKQLSKLIGRPTTPIATTIASALG